MVLTNEMKIQIAEGERRRQEECRQGLRPWLIPPGDPRLPDGLAGMTPEEEERLARFNANCEILFEELRRKGIVTGPRIRPRRTPFSP